MSAAGIVDDEQPVGWRRVLVGTRVIALVPAPPAQWVVPAPPRAYAPAPSNETREILSRQSRERAERRRQRRQAAATGGCAASLPDDRFIEMLRRAARLGAVVVLSCTDGVRRPYRVRVVGEKFEFELAADVDLAKVTT